MWPSSWLLTFQSNVHRRRFTVGLQSPEQGTTLSPKQSYLNHGFGCANLPDQFPHYEWSGSYASPAEESQRVVGGSSKKLWVLFSHHSQVKLTLSPNMLQGWPASRRTGLGFVRLLQKTGVYHGVLSPSRQDLHDGV